MARQSAAPATRGPLTNRRRFLTMGTAAAAAAIAPTPFAALLAATPAPSERACCPVRIAAPRDVRRYTVADAAEGNKQAMAIAGASKLVQRANEALVNLAGTIADSKIRTTVLALLDNPAPTYQIKSPTDADKQQVRQDLLDAGLIPDKTTVEGIFPPVADANVAPQAFWSAPGSTYAGHHSYPGGLVVHEWFNATMAGYFLQTYDTVYGLASAPAAIDPSIALAAPLWHDVHKVDVFQWNADGSEFVEQTIADTGAHHPTSGAEAIVRGMPAAFVVAMLSAHDAPTTVKSNPDQTGLQRLVNYLRAAAIIAHVDPVATGLLRMVNGEFALAQDPPRIEGHINHLSDHDFLFSGDSAAILIKALQQVAAGYGIDPAATPARFNLFRNLVFAQIADMRLYGALQVGGASAVRAMIDTEADLTQLA